MRANEAETAIERRSRSRDLSLLRRPIRQSLRIAANRMLSWQCVGRSDQSVQNIIVNAKIRYPQSGHITQKRGLSKSQWTDCGHNRIELNIYYSSTLWNRQFVRPQNTQKFQIRKWVEKIDKPQKEFLEEIQDKYVTDADALGSVRCTKYWWELILWRRTNATAYTLAKTNGKSSMI